MAAEQEDDKQYEASQKKLDDARKKGDIAKSNDLITAGSYAGFLVCAVGFGAGLLGSLGEVLSILFERADSIAQITFGGSQTPIMGATIQMVIFSVWPWFAAPAATAALVIAAQRAFIFAPSKLEPKLSRISIVEGVKNKFGRQGLFEFLKSLAKLSLFSVVLGLYLVTEIDRIIASAQLSASLVAVEFAQLTVFLLAIVFLIALGIGAIDYLFQFAHHAQKLRMSRKELTDELKQSEGDPMLKQQRRQRGIDIATNRMLADVPKADVVIVNPEHYAVALEWSRLPGDAPVCIAKGVDEIAARIREVAAENDIPIYRDPPTTRAVFAAVDLGEEIHPEHYKAVAAAIRFAEGIRRTAQK